MKKILLYLFLISLIMVSCDSMPLFWRPDTVCYLQLTSRNQENGIRYLTSECHYYNYGYINYEKNKDVPKRFGFLNIYVESDIDFELKNKNIVINSNNRIRKCRENLCNKGQIVYNGVNIISIPIKTCLFMNDTINVILISDEGDSLMNTTIMADESLSSPFKLHESGSTYIDSIWNESIRNLEIQRKH